MPARDTYHDAVKNALIKDGWTITHDPLVVELGGDRLFIDLGAERVIGAEKGTRKIAVEVKTVRRPIKDDGDGKGARAVCFVPYLLKEDAARA